MPSDGGTPFEDDDQAVHLPGDGRGRIHSVRDDARRSAWAAGLRWQRPPPVMPAEPPADWVLPWWAERQLDPDSPAHAPEPSQCRYWNRDQRVKARLLANTRGRSWTLVGRPETLDRATVDPRGLVTWRAWSLDWWIRADKGWVFPSRGPDVRQCLVAGMPVVETLLPVGGGDVVHRVAAAGDASSTIGEATLRRAYPRRTGREASADAAIAPEVFVVEIANRTPEPVAVALAVRPCNLGAFEIEEPDIADIWEWSNLWAIDEITVDGRLLSLDDGGQHGFGLAYVMFDRDPADIVVGSHRMDCAAALESRDGLAVAEGTGSEPASTRAGDAATDPQAPPPSPTSVKCPKRLATAAAIFPLAAGATLRAAVPGRGLAFTSNAAVSQQAATEVLRSRRSLEQVANDWSRRLGAGCRLDLPRGRLADAALAARACQLLGTAPCDDGPGVIGPMLWPATYTDAQFAGDDLVQLLGLIESGELHSVRDLLIRQTEAQHRSGAVSSMGHSVTGTSLVLAEHLLSLHRDPKLADAISKFIKSAARWLLSPEAAHREEPWTVREGLRAGFRLLRRVGADSAAADLRRSAMSLRKRLRIDPGAPPDTSTFYLNIRGRVSWEEPPRADLDDSVSWLWDWDRRDAGLWVHAAVPWAPPLPFVTFEPAEGTPADFVVDVLATRGYDMVATALLAFAEARPAPARAFERLEALASVASPTLNWPTFMDPQLLTGTNGEGHDLKVGGLFLRTLLRLLVDAPEGPAVMTRPGLRLAGHWPEAWLGQPVEIHDVPARLGTVSWAVRWHGDRPALLWDVVAHDPAGPVPHVTAPGLDPSFAATGWHGEAMLAPVRPPAA